MALDIKFALAFQLNSKAKQRNTQHYQCNYYHETGVTGDWCHTRPVVASQLVVESMTG